MKHVKPLNHFILKNALKILLHITSHHKMARQKESVTGIAEFFKLSGSELSKKWKWHDKRPSMVTHTQNLCSAFNPSKVHTHTAVNTYTEQWTAIYAAAPGEQFGVRCLAQGHLSRGIEVDRALDIRSPPTIPAGPRLKLATFRLWV